MELLSESAISSCFSAVRRKRSDSRRRPHPNPKPVSHSQSAFMPMSPFDNGQHEDIDLYSSKVLEPECPGNQRKLKKLKLKLGGVTHTLHTKSSSEITSGGGFLGVGSSDATDARGAHQYQHQASSMDYNYKYDLVQKSKRVAKQHSFDDGFDEDNDEEIRYLKKLKASKIASGCGYRQEMPSDDQLTNTRDKEGFVDLPEASGIEMTITTRKRALECPGSGGLVKFPNGLPDAPSKKQKLSDVQHKARKAEVAQRRRLQADRAAKEAEAEAIRKILGQDSSRKKKEEKLKKQQKDLAQEKTDMATTLRPNTIRMSMGPNGTVLTFSEDLGLPKIFNSMPCKYPPPREKCVGPNCTNEYKYRDSKLKLPLCSLDCYKAVQGNAGLLPAC